MSSTLQSRCWSSPASTQPVRRTRATALHASPPASRHGAGHSPAGPFSRRAALLLGTAGALAVALPPTAQANFVEDIVRGTLRPEVTPVEAVSALLDASKALKSLAALAATPADSEQRFRSRALLPGWAGRLRPVQAAVPVVAALIAGGSDSEATLSAKYGGTGGADEGQGAADGVYIALGRVLTISGRTIRKTAQDSPDFAREADTEIERFLKKVPKDVYKLALEAQQAARTAA